MILDSLRATALKNNPLATVTWGDITKLIVDFQSTLPVVQVAQKVSKFSVDEIAILQMMAQEMPTKEIAKTLHKSHRTVEAIRDNLKKKTGMKTTIGLMLYAVKAELINLKETEIAANPIS